MRKNVILYICFNALVLSFAFNLNAMKKVDESSFNCLPIFWIVLEKENKRLALEGFYYKNDVDTIKLDGIEEYSVESLVKLESIFKNNKNLGLKILMGMNGYNIKHLDHSKDKYLEISKKKLSYKAYYADVRDEKVWNLNSHILGIPNEKKKFDLDGHLKYFCKKKKKVLDNLCKRLRSIKKDNLLYGEKTYLAEAYKGYIYETKKSHLFSILDLITHDLASFGFLCEIIKFEKQKDVDKSILRCSYYNSIKVWKFLKELGWVEVDSQVKELTIKGYKVDSLLNFGRLKIITPIESECLIRNFLDCCFYCEKKGLKKICTKCRIVGYCGMDCRAKDYDNHDRYCYKIKKLFGLCLVCGKLSKHTCSRCKNARYCCSSCQKLDWKKHKEHCKKK